MTQRLRLLPYKEYRGVEKIYSVIFYYLPVFGAMYRRRVELCLDQCKGGENILEIGFGSGLTFLNLNDMYKKIYGLDLTCDVNVVKEVFAPYGIAPDLRNGNVLDMPYADNQFDTVLLISILEHLKPGELQQAFNEISPRPQAGRAGRVRRAGGASFYGLHVSFAGVRHPPASFFHRKRRGTRRGKDPSKRSDAGNESHARLLRQCL